MGVGYGQAGRERADDDAGDDIADYERLTEKLREYRAQGTRLGWLIDPKRKVVEVYRPRRRVEVLTAPANLSGEDVLPGFVLDLKGILT